MNITPPDPRHPDAEIEAEGHRWIAYWLPHDDDDASFYIFDGRQGAEVTNPHEWQNLCAEAAAISSDPKNTYDLACERMKRLMQERGEWPASSLDKA